jgi:ElaB/YqjD/DUF883 family membrane-anchored ribosome-binding protein
MSIGRGQAKSLRGFRTFGPEICCLWESKYQEDQMAQTDRTYADKASQMANRAERKFEHVADHASARINEAGDAVRDYSKQAADKIEDSIHDRPMATIAGAVALGVVLGVLLKR